jgi:hypothetical protein
MKEVFREIDAATSQVGRVVNATGQLVHPMREDLFRRFPILAPLLIAFGVAATFFGIERLIMDIAWLNDRPFLIFLLGVTALIISGKLYQKLG